MDPVSPGVLIPVSHRYCHHHWLLDSIRFTCSAFPARWSALWPCWLGHPCPEGA